MGWSQSGAGVVVLILSCRKRRNLSPRQISPESGHCCKGKKRHGTCKQVSSDVSGLDQQLEEELEASGITTRVR